MTEKGFSLIEIVVTLVIIGILSIVVVSRTGCLLEYRITAAMDKVRQDLRYSKEFAMNNGCRARIVFDLTGNTSYTVYSNKTGSMQLDVPDPETDSSPFTMTLNQGNYSGVKITAVAPGSILEFDHLGRPYDGSGNLLAVNATITLESTNYIYIYAQTGKIE